MTGGAVGDLWQHLVVSAVALWGLWIIVRPFLPGRREEGAACENCASGAAAQARRRRDEASGRNLVQLGSGRVGASQDRGAAQDRAGRRLAEGSGAASTDGASGGA